MSNSKTKAKNKGTVVSRKKLTFHNRTYKNTNEFSRPFICTTSVLRMNSHEPYPYYKHTASVLRMCVIFFVRIRARKVVPRCLWQVVSHRFKS